MLKLWISILIALSSETAFAYYTVQDTGDVLAPGRYSVGGELQAVTSPGSGVNMLGRFEGAFDDEFNYRGYVGFGETDFQVGGQVKWVPFPDVDQQPAIGFVAGAFIANYEDNAEFTIRAYPIISKKFVTEERGDFVPYAALPIGFRNYDEESDTPIQFVAGLKYIHPDYKGVYGFAEFGAKLDDSVSYLSVGATFPLDEDNKFNLEP